MCRLFGFRSAVPSQIHRSLLLETNALQQQSLDHPDGWGLAYYVGGQPQVARGIASAYHDEDFANLCEFVSAQTVVAHVRKASVGELSIENTHPFEHGRWVMAHNGTIPDFESVRPTMEALIAPHYRADIDGDTDSERLFGLFMTRLAARCSPHSPDVTLADVFASMEQIIMDVVGMCAPFGGDPSLNMVVTNGTLMAAFRHGRSLYFSTHKERCPDRSACPAFAPCCEAPVTIGQHVNHLVLASEKIGGPAVWQEMPEDDLLGVDGAMYLRRRSLKVPVPPLAKSA